ncbi:cGMP-dependent 3',5'-cyclic phosphodiesterase-like isoform X2 [Grus americana]|nr:cGMP-dependent 3',5'-cyclic phosphodiesterase-like isoform X2 [Grus americana]
MGWTGRPRPRCWSRRVRSTLPQPCREPGRAMGTLQDTDALLSLGAVIDVSCLRDALRHALVSLLPRVEHVYIYLLDGETRLICDDPPHELPPEGKLR